MDLRLLPLLLASVAPQERAPAELLDRVVLRQEGKDYTARQVVDAAARWDASLRPTLEADPAYLRLYLDSPVFLEQTRAFSDALLAAADGAPEASAEQINREALAWAADHGLRADAAAALAHAGIEIETRARLIAAQPDGFGANELRQHMLRSVPEFFGQLQIAWMRVPLVDVQTGAAFGEGQRRAIYELLDGIGRALRAGTTDWDKALEEITADADLHARGGPVGILDRTMTGRYEEEFLRPLFDDLGFRRPEGALLRGPILTPRWAYLVRVEALVVSGVVDLERVRPRVERSLREHLLRQVLAELGAGTERKVLLPLAA